MKLHREWGIGTRVGRTVWWTVREIALVRANIEHVPVHNPWYVGIYGVDFADHRQLINDWMYRNGMPRIQLAALLGVNRHTVGAHMHSRRLPRVSRAFARRLGAVTGYAPAYIYMLAKAERTSMQKRTFPIRPARRLTPEEIISWRGKHRVSIRGLADLLDISHNAIVKWESGQRQPPAMLEFALEELARRLKFSGYEPPRISTLTARKRKPPVPVEVPDEDDL